MQVSIKYLCPKLTLHIVNHLSKRLRPSSVLQVLAWCDQYSNTAIVCDLAPSAPPIWDVLDPCEEQEPQAMALASSCPTTYTRVDCVQFEFSDRRQSEPSNTCDRRESDPSNACDNSRLRVHSESCASPAQELAKVYSNSSLPSLSHVSVTDPTEYCRELVPRCFAHIDSHSAEVSYQLHSLHAKRSVRVKKYFMHFIYFFFRTLVTTSWNSL